MRRSVARPAHAAPDRRIARSGDRPFTEVARETAGLPAGVVARWFRSNLARPLLDGPPPGPVPAGAIVWAAEPGPDLYPGALAVVPPPPAAEGPSALPEPEGDEQDVPGLREAVEAALAAAPAKLRAGAAAHVERALAEAGL